MKKAIITGLTGMDGSTLADLLLEKDYEVYGIVRRVSTPNVANIQHLLDHPRVHLESGDLTDLASLVEICKEVMPDEVYNLAAQSFVGSSWRQPITTCEITGLGALNVFEAVKQTCPTAKTYQAGSSEMFSGEDAPQSLTTPFKPRSPYGAAKLFAHHLARIYRESYGMFIACGVLFNHEGPRRGIEFVTQKIVDHAVRQHYCGETAPLKLGNLDAKRDWSHAKDMCLNLDTPILTTSGWKMHYEIEVGEEVINFNVSENHITTDTVIEKLYLPSDGVRVILKGRGVYLNVTPQHRIYYQQKSKNSRAGWSNWKVTTAQEFHELISGKATRTKYDYRLPHFQNYDKPDLESVSDSQIYLLGALLAEGCLHKPPFGRGIQASISQSFIANKEAHQKIKECINNLSLEANEKLRQTGVTEWVFSADSSRIIASWFDGYDFHTMPSYCFSFSARQANILFEAMMDCDGHWGGLTYKSSRYALATSLQTIAHLAGYRTTGVVVRESGGNIVVPQKGQCYEVGIITKRRQYTYIQESEISDNNEDACWCVKTNHQTIISRDNECISISGNCRGMWMMLQEGYPEDYILASGETHSVKEFVDLVYAELGTRLLWGEDSMGYDLATNVQGRVLVQSVPEFYRENEVNILQGDPTYANKYLGWEPEFTFSDLISDMIVSRIKKYYSKGV